MSQRVATPMIEVDKIDVEDGFNPRTHKDSEALTRLAESVKKTGVVQPLAVVPPTVAGSSSWPDIAA